MSLPDRAILLDYMSPTIAWKRDCIPYGSLHAGIFTRALACTVYSRLTSGATLTISDGGSVTQEQIDSYAATPNESHLHFLDSSATIPDSIPEVKDIGAYLSDQFKVYQVPASHLTIVKAADSKVSHFNGAFYRRFASAMPRLLPWLFKQQPLAPDELSYLRALSTPETTSEALSDMTEALYNKTDLAAKALDKAIDSLFVGTLNSRKASLKRDIEGHYQNIKEHRASIANLFKRITQLSCELAGLDSKDESAFSAELKDYLHSQKGVIVNFDGESLILSITTTLSNFNPDDVDTFVFHDSRPYQNFNSSEESDARLLYQAIFSDRTFNVKMAANYKLDFNCHVTPMSGSVSMSSFGAVPNPHINRHSCLGNYEPMLEDAEDHRDFISAIAICQQSAGSMNLVETISSRYFFEDFAAAYHQDIPVILTPAGESITPKQAVEQLKKGA